MDSRRPFSPTWRTVMVTTCFGQIRPALGAILRLVLGAGCAARAAPPRRFRARR
jgi:hypothetical protein